MSSEDEIAFVDKCFTNKPKRVRQRVDAGEPRNSYATIPNFTSRPTNGYIVSSAGSKLISDLLARQRAAESVVCGMMTVEDARMNGSSQQSPSPAGVLNLGKPKNNNSAYLNGNDESTDMFSHHHELVDNSHLLRTILQDRQNFVDACGGRVSPCPSNSSTSSGTSSRTDGSLQEEDDDRGLGNLLGEAVFGAGHASETSTRCGSAPPLAANPSSAAATPVSAVERPGEMKEDCNDNTTDDDRMSGPLHRERNESGRDSPELCSSQSQSPKSVRPEIGCSSIEIKRARVETIVSNMLQVPTNLSSGRSPSSFNGSGPIDPNVPVNGCKKRKLYQPQQHEASKVNGLDDYNEDELEDGGAPPNKKSDSKTMRGQLKTLRKQLASMEQRYLELFEATRHESNGASSPIRSDDQEHTSVDEQINRDCESEDKRKDLHHSNNHNHRGVPLPNGLPNVYFHSTPKDRFVKDRDFLSGDDKQRHTGESRQSCIVKTSTANSQPVSPSGSCADLEWFVDALKSEISTTLPQVIDSIVSKYAQRRTKLNVREPVEPPPPPPQQVPPPIQPIHKEFNLLSQMLDRKSPRTKVIDRGNRVNGHANSQRLSPYQENCSSKGPLFFSPSLKGPLANFFMGGGPHHQASLPPVSQGYIPPPPPPPSLLTAVSLASQMSSLTGEPPEQTEAMSLVVAPKKKRHKVTDTRITPRTVSRLLGQELETPSKYQHLLGMNLHDHHLNYHHHIPPVMVPPPPAQPLVPVTLPTTVAIPNPSLQHQSDMFSALQFEAHRLGHYSSQEQMMDDDSLLHGSPSLQSSFLGHPGSPDSMHYKQENGDGSDAGDSQTYDSGLTMTSTLTPMHLRKAKLMFFYVRYPSSAILKMYFPDIKFNKNNTAQLVKWFSNFREFYYIQMEKYARQSISDGVKSCDEIKVSGDAELLRVLNLHYNRNNHIEVPDHFRFVVEQTLKEFFKAVFAGKDSEQSWKKAIYKVIARLDDGVPDYFKSPNFLEQLE